MREMTARSRSFCRGILSNGRCPARTHHLASIFYIVRLQLGMDYVAFYYHLFLSPRVGGGWKRATYDARPSYRITPQDPGRGKATFWMDGRLRCKCDIRHLLGRRSGDKVHASLVTIPQNILTSEKRGWGCFLVRD